MLVLKLKGSVVIQLIPQSKCRAVSASNDRAVGGITIDGFRDASIQVGITEIGAVLAESARKLSIEAGCVEYPRSAGDALGVPNQHTFIQELVVRVRVNNVDR